LAEHHGVHLLLILQMNAYLGQLQLSEGAAFMAKAVLVHFHVPGFIYPSRPV